jgi:mRNA-degrading endonuclease toxin of MazEF toxin-antitoxin module
MPLPSPEPGLVICYEFLWSHEHEAGEEYGQKRRPCAIILTTKTAAGQTSVTVAPITHREPADAVSGIEIPPKVKAHLGLDTERSWIVLSELNQFVWPGVDLYPVPGGRPGQYDYGFLPPRLFKQVVDAILALDAAVKRVTART